MRWRGWLEEGGCGAGWVEVWARPVPTSRIDWRWVAVLASQGPRAPLQHPWDTLTHHPVRAQQPSRTLSTFHFPRSWGLFCCYITLVLELHGDRYSECLCCFQGWTTPLPSSLATMTRYSLVVKKPIHWKVYLNQHFFLTPPFSTITYICVLTPTTTIPFLSYFKTSCFFITVSSNTGRRLSSDEKEDFNFNDNVIFVIFPYCLSVDGKPLLFYPSPLTKEAWQPHPVECKILLWCSAWLYHAVFKSTRKEDRGFLGISKVDTKVTLAQLYWSCGQPFSQFDATVARSEIQY